MEDVTKVVIDEKAINGESDPILIYGETVPKKAIAGAE